MAHQAHNIPWNLLASNLKWCSDQPCNRGAANLHLRFRPQQAKELAYFVEAFLRNIAEHSICERKKYPDRYDPPDRDEILLDDDTVKKITPTVHALRSHNEWQQCWTKQMKPKCPERLCQHQGAAECECPIPYEERRASSFLRRYSPNGCYLFFQDNGPAYFNLELVKTLLLHGRMDIILRVCAHPDADLEKWWHMAPCYDTDHDVGWEHICRMALRAYICLNIIHCFPETWDMASGKTEERDYRRASFYQHAVRNCTLGGITSDVATYPHRQFFGIIPGQFRDYSSFSKAFTSRGALWSSDPSKKYPYGLMSYEVFLACEGPIGYQPHASDIPLVRGMLCDKGLPMELGMYILALAEYTPARRLPVPHDPLHSDNRDELAKYLKHCWQLLVRCDMMARALKMEIHWDEMICSCLVDFWDCQHCGKWNVWEYDEVWRHWKCRFL